MRIENTYGNETHNLRIHFNLLLKSYDFVKKMDQRRFEVLRSAFHPTLEELRNLSNLLVNASKRYFFKFY
jgi:hypothetical protein